MSGSSFSDREARARRLLRNLFDHARIPEPTSGGPAHPPPAGGLEPFPAFSRYEVRDKVGEGATAVVYRAWDRELHRLVALKVLKESQTLFDVARQRFRRESQAAAVLSHPNVVPVYDVGEENGRLFIVMEFVEGRPLSDVLRGDLPVEQRVAILERVARGVAAAHAQGIVHRDLKPGNILVTAAGEPKVADFGLAHLQDDAARLTRTGSTLGTPLYMSPEQVRGRAQDISPRTDVYALGAMLYEAVVGHPPHEAETLLDLYQNILEQDPLPLRKFRPDAPEDLDTVARKAMSKDPAARYPSAAEFAEDLRRHAAGEPIAARPESVAMKLWRRSARRRSAVAGALFLVLATAGAVAWIARRETSEAAVVEEATGDVQLSWSGAATVGKGHLLRPGQILRSGPSGAATLKAEGGGRLWLAAHSMVQALPGTRDGFFVPLGTASGERVTVRTPHGQADLDRGAARVEVFPTATWVEVTRGSVRVRDLDGRTADITQGLIIALGSGMEFSPRPATEGLLGYWPFEDATGNVARDASGHGNDGVFSHAPAAQDGRKGKGAGLDGMNFLEVPGLSGAKFPLSGTLAFWVKADFTLQDFTELFDRYDRSRPHLFVRGMRSPHGLQVVFQQNGYVFERLSVIAEGEWNHIAVTWDTAAKQGAVYLNGALSFSGPMSEPWTPTGQFFRIGGMGFSATALRGVVDDVRLYGTPLRPEGIRDLFNR